MYFKKIETKGLAHYSYLVASQGQAIIIDPMRDLEEYLDILEKEGLKLKYIFETHRNEDYVSGSKELSQITGAQVFTSSHDDLEYEFGDKISDGDEKDFGELKIKALHTPGHTKGHLSYVLFEKDKDNPYMVFTGDCLFMGDLGRTDFYGEDMLEEMTGQIYDSVFDKLLKLGDGVIVNPAHGPGSACGEDMDDRPVSTIGYERLNNPKLQFTDKEEFIKNHGKMRIKPSYFDKMEVCNIKGAGPVNCEDELKALKLEDIKDDYTIVDLRSPQAFATSHIPGSHYLSLGNLASFLGATLDTDEPLVFLAENDDMESLRFAYLTAKRTGFDNVKGYLKGGIMGYITSGKKWGHIKNISAEDYCSLEGVQTVDIRNVERMEEIGQKREGFFKIPLKVLYKEYEMLDKDKTLYIMCNSGNTATTAASMLIKKGYDPVVIAGGYQAVSKHCEI